MGEQKLQNFEKQFSLLRNDFKNLQLLQGDEFTFKVDDISDLLCRSAKIYENFLEYFKHVHNENKRNWEMNKYNVNNKLYKIGTSIVKNNLISGFEYFFGFVEKGCILLFASKIGVLTAVAINDSEEDIEDIVNDLVIEFEEDDEFFFVYTIAILATDKEKIFINNIDEKIFTAVHEIIKGKL